jgi:hypothetical protein
MQRKGKQYVKTYSIYCWRHLWSKTRTLEAETLWKLMKNLSGHTDFLCELETSLRMRETPHVCESDRGCAVIEVSCV